MRNARLVSKTLDKTYDQAKNDVISFLDKTGNTSFDWVITHGGFLRDKLPKKSVFLFGIESHESDLSVLTNFCEEKIENNFLDTRIKQKLKSKVKYLTLGIDLLGEYNGDYHAELVTIYDCEKDNFIHWTGKSYPTSSQLKTLYYIKDLNSHFFSDGRNYHLILGCHDLNIFSARSENNRSETGYLGSVAKEINSLCAKLEPISIFHHPHTTDSIRTWMLGWSGVKKHTHKFQLGCSGISYATKDGNLRDPLEKILRATKFGNIDDVVV